MRPGLLRALFTPPLARGFTVSFNAAIEGCMILIDAILLLMFRGYDG